MDKWGILIFVAGVVAYYFTKQKYPFLAFVSGVGAGIVIGAVWFYFVLMNTPFP